MKWIAIWLASLFMPICPLVAAEQPDDGPAKSAQRADIDSILFHAHFLGGKPGPLTQWVKLEADTFKRHLEENPCNVTIRMTNRSERPLSLPVQTTGIRHLSIFVVDEDNQPIARTTYGKNELLPVGGGDFTGISHVKLEPKDPWSEEGGHVEWRLDLKKCFDLPPGKYRASFGYWYNVASEVVEFEIVGLNQVSYNAR